MIGPYQDFMDYIDMELDKWKIKEGAPEWAKKDFKDFKEYMGNKNIEIGDLKI